MRIIMPYLLYTAMFLLALFLQAEIFPYLQIFGAKPDLLLLIVVFSAIKTDWRNGLLVGLMAGFWLDALTGTYFAVNILVYGVIGACFGATAKRINYASYYSGFFATLVATVGGGLLMMLCLQLIGGGLPFLRTISGTIIPVTFYNLLLVIISVPLAFLRRRNHGLKVAYIDLYGNGIVMARGNEIVDNTALGALQEAREGRMRKKADRLRKRNRDAAAQRGQKRKRNRTSVRRKIHE